MREEGLVLQNKDGCAKSVSTEALSDLFSFFGDKVECVVLNVCYSEVQASTIVKDINYAIGMSHKIRDDAAIAFSTGFYQALGYGQSIEQSYKFGCNAIQLEISDNSAFRSVLSPQRRKLEVAKTVETVVIPEHLKPVLRKKKNITTLADNFTSSFQLDLQSDIDKALEKENALKQYHQEFQEYLPNKTRKLFVGSAVATLALTLSFFSFHNISSFKQETENERSTQVEKKGNSLRDKPIENYEPPSIKKDHVRTFLSYSSDLSIYEGKYRITPANFVMSQTE